MEGKDCEDETPSPSLTWKNACKGCILPQVDQYIAQRCTIIIIHEVHSTNNPSSMYFIRTVRIYILCTCLIYIGHW